MEDRVSSILSADVKEKIADRQDEQKSIQGAIVRRLRLVLVPSVDVIQIMVAAFPEEVMDRSRKVR